MNINFVAPAILVKDIKKSKSFYETILGQEIEMDNGEHISFKNGFSIWQGDHAYGIIFNKNRIYKEHNEQNSFELYFETTELDNAWTHLVNLEVKQLHNIHEHPWGQRGFRVYDPDGHIVEVSEPLSFVALRFLNDGLSFEEISARTSIPVSLVKEMVNV